MEITEKPHVVVHPLPVQGHIKPMLCLAMLLSQAGFYITFIITHHIHKRLPNLPALTAQFPNLHFQSISDGFPDGHPRNMNSSYFSEMKIKTKPHFKQVVVSSPVSCIIADGYLVYSFEVAKELRLPIFTFVSHGACFLRAYYSIPILIQQGHLPFPDDDINHEIESVPGLEGLLRRKNLPLLRLEADNPLFQAHYNDILGMNRSSGVIINTFDELEVKCLPHITTHFHKVYTVGPLHALLNSKIGNIIGFQSHASLWKTDQNCFPWLDSQPLKSVLYVSFGTLAKRSISQLLEFWHGLVSSGHPFLWVMHPDVLLDEERENVILPEQLQKGAKENGYIVDWAPQEQVLAHSSVGGFLTHCGWNSILESIMTKIPLICWPHANDQNINTDLVCKVLRIGIELEAFDRSTTEATVKTLVGSQRKEFQKSVDKFAKCGQDDIGHGGSSNHNLETLVKDIKMMKLKSQVHPQKV